MSGEPLPAALVEASKVAGYLMTPGAGYKRVPDLPSEVAGEGWVVYRHPTLKWEVHVNAFYPTGLTMVIQGPDGYVKANTVNGDFDWIVVNLP